MRGKGADGAGVRQEPIWDLRYNGKFLQGFKGAVTEL